MSKGQPLKNSKAESRANAKRSKNREDRRAKRRDEVRASWATGTLAVLIAIGSLAYFLSSTGPPFEGRGAALANWLYAQFGPVGPALPWLAISAALAFIAVAASRGWGKDVP